MILYVCCYSYSRFLEFEKNTTSKEDVLRIFLVDTDLRRFPTLNMQGRLDVRLPHGTKACQAASVSLQSGGGFWEGKTGRSECSH